MAFADIRVVALAGNGTLFDMAGAVATASVRLGARTATVGALWQAKIFEYATLSQQVGRAADAWSITGEALDHALAAHGIADALARAQLMQAVLQAPLFADVAPALAALAQPRRKLALLTNAAPVMAVAQVKAGGIYAAFDALISAEAAGTRKLLAASYALVGERFGVAPREVLFVTAHPWDVAGAAQAGLAAVWLNRAGAPPEYDWARPRAVIGTLADLPALLPAEAAAA
jgi:2-haloacid dehalogenase